MMIVSRVISKSVDLKWYRPPEGKWSAANAYHWGGWRYRMPE